MQLGLVLALVIVYVALEYSSTKKITILEHIVTGESVNYVFTAPTDIIIQRKKITTEKQVQKKTLLIDIKLVSDDTAIKSIIDLPTDADTTLIDKIEDIIEVIDKGNDGIKPIPYILLEEAPIFPGCEGLEKDESKACFTKQMTKFVNRKFDVSITEGLNLTGKQRIIALFTIDKSGLVTDILIKAPHKRLEKEALRVIQKLPKMIPGKQRKKAVPVKYTLPIVFKIQ